MASKEVSSSNVIYMYMYSFHLFILFLYHHYTSLQHCGDSYTCTITSGTSAGITDWTLPTGTCPSNTFPDKLSQLVSGACAPQGSSTCGPYTASSLPPSDVTYYCLSFILTVNMTAAMNGSTVTCSNTNQITPSITTVVSLATINVVGTSFIALLNSSNTVALSKTRILFFSSFYSSSLAL